jgi:hypothetical protein
MLFDMSFSQKYFHINKLPSSFTNKLFYNNPSIKLHQLSSYYQLSPSSSPFTYIEREPFLIHKKENNIKPIHFIDIGSGGGTATIHLFCQFFEEGVVQNVILSDLHPKIEQWRTLTNHNKNNPICKSISNIDFISIPVDADNIYSLLQSYKPTPNISFFGSLHHLEIDKIDNIFKQIYDAKTSLFIVEPRRFPPLIQFLHILFLPLFGMFFYTLISLFGSSIQNMPFSIYRIFIVPFFMTLDHIIGASRRYCVDDLQYIAKEHNLEVSHHKDLIFDYYIIQPFS